jgi:hypothetical protein
MITLYDFLSLSECDYDTYDTKYDVEVTVCWIGEESDNYDKFCNEIIKKVNVVKINRDMIMVNWSELIERNIDKFKEFTKENWYETHQYEDDIDEFIYQWIREIHYYMAGYVSEDFYGNLVELVKNLK